MEQPHVCVCECLFSSCLTKKFDTIPPFCSSFLLSSWLSASSPPPLLLIFSYVWTRCYQSSFVSTKLLELAMLWKNKNKQPINWTLLWTFFVCSFIITYKAGIRSIREKVMLVQLIILFYTNLLKVLPFTITLQLQ